MKLDLIAVYLTGIELALCILIDFFPQSFQEVMYFASLGGYALISLVVFLAVFSSKSPGDK